MQQQATTAPDILLLKHMVCHRCILVVRDLLDRHHIGYSQITFGEVTLTRPLDSKQLLLLQQDLKDVGFEIIDHRNTAIVEQTKTLILRKARMELADKEQRMKLSAYLSGQLHFEYTYLSTLFSDVEGRTIEKYFIEQRIEYAKELLIYGELTLSQIALELGYSSTAHLSRQFKAITGLTPSHFKKVGHSRRRALDDV